MIRKTLKFLLFFAGLLLLVYFLGPEVDTPILDRSQPDITSDLAQLQAEINRHEAAIPNIKPDNEARIIWADSVPKKTAYSIVYLHGWSASQEEGDPIHIETAKRYGYNLYLPRLSGHGLIEDEPLLTITADKLVNSAEEAIAVGKQLGDKVILMATSTGGTLALYLAGDDPDIAGLLLYSPNIEIFDSNAKLLTKPWGVQLAKLVKGGDYHEFEDPSEADRQYWTTKYRVEALAQLQVLMDETMTERLSRGLGNLFFFRHTITRMRFTRTAPYPFRPCCVCSTSLGTPSDQKRKVAFPNVGEHVMTSYITSKDLESVKRETNRFMEEVLDLKPRLQ